MGKNVWKVIGAILLIVLVIVVYYLVAPWFMSQETRIIREQIQYDDSHTISVLTWYEEAMELETEIAAETDAMVIAAKEAQLNAIVLKMKEEIRKANLDNLPVEILRFINSH
jgi:predicted PurR-regulated permease PerM